jgi:hypothetical protein
MGNALNHLKPPQGAQLTRKEGSLKRKNIDKLDPAQRAWSDNVMRVLELKSSSSQARVLSGAISAAQLVETNGTDPEKRTARELRATVIAAGKPPWKDAGKAWPPATPRCSSTCSACPRTNACSSRWTRTKRASTSPSGSTARTPMGRSGPRSCASPPTRQPPRS